MDKPKGFHDADMAAITNSLPDEKLGSAGGGASKTYSTFDGAVCVGMTLKRAREIRRLRVDEGFTWRSVADETSKSWGMRQTSNQFLGISFCLRAAEALGEDGDGEPWN